MTVPTLNPAMFAMLIAFACLIFLLKLVLGGRARAISAIVAPDIAARPFLTAREQAMLDTLEELLPGYRLHAQVAMGALLTVRGSAGRKVSPADRNSFSQKIVDFVVQDRATGQIVALIEVDDASHRPSADRARDAMTGKAGYRTFRIPGRIQPDLAQVRPHLQTLIGPMVLQVPGGVRGDI
jgi:hypothetical protein